MQSKRTTFIALRILDRLRRIFIALRNPFHFLAMKRRKNQQKLKAYELINKLERKTDSTSHCVMFSKDRPLQLNALISSYKFFIKDAPKISITYGSSNERFKKSYLEVLERHRDIIEHIDYREDHQFQQSFLSIVDKVKTKSIFFLVDDNIFTREITISELANYDLASHIPSLRMHEKLEWCYNRFVRQKLPPFYDDLTQDKTHFSWLYSEGECDWNYPLSLDGHIFDTEEMKIILHHIEFNSPNSLELGMQLFNDTFKKRKGVSFKKPVIVNVPCNRIQDEIDNPYAQTYHQDELLEKWEQGLEIDFKKISHLINKSAHQSIKFDFISRT
jgi:hypothetical protein